MIYPGLHCAALLTTLLLPGSALESDSPPATGRTNPALTQDQDPEPPEGEEGTSPVTPEKVGVAIRLGVKFLVDTQNANGSWGGVKNATFTSGIGNPATYKAWQIGASALATRSLLELGTTDEQIKSTNRGLDFLIENPNPVRPAEWDVDNNWALIYGLDAVARALQHPRYKDTERGANLRVLRLGRARSFALLCASR